MGLALVLTVGIGLVVTTFLSGLAGGAGHVLTGYGAHVGAVLISLVLNIGVFWLASGSRPRARSPWRDLRTGAAIAAACWQVLQLVGGYVVSHQLHRASELYGTFGIVLGLLAWLFLQAEVTLYAAEVDVVLTRRLWPRSIMPAETPEPASGRQARRGHPAGAPASPRSRAQAAQAAARPAQDGQPGEPAPVSVPAPRAAVERGGDDENRTVRWISRARRAVGRR